MKKCTNRNAEQRPIADEVINELADILNRMGYSSRTLSPEPCRPAPASGQNNSYSRVIGEAPASGQFSYSRRVIGEGYRQRVPVSFCASILTHPGTIICHFCIPS